jgi:hypothetical protein
LKVTAYEAALNIKRKNRGDNIEVVNRSNWRQAGMEDGRTG